MKPDFSKRTIDTLAKRAAYLCSNPDCRVATVGPNSDPNAATVVGEAAHISSAREGGKRFRPELTDQQRAEITNGIWLCRNCHRLIDSDETLYPEALLHTWREQHETYVQAKLGNTLNHVRLQTEQTNSLEFQQYPLIIQEIAVDKPFAWEWRLTAELLRTLNKPVFQQLRDIQDGLYYKPGDHVDAEAMIPWTNDRLVEISSIIPPLQKLLERLVSSWGAPGEAGNQSEIHHICKLMTSTLGVAITIEERLAFDKVPDEFSSLLQLMKGLMNRTLQDFETIPDFLDKLTEEALRRKEEGNVEPKNVVKTIVFELPDGWNNEVVQEMRRALHQAGLL